MSKKRASVSVVVPCFNCASTIERALASVFRQTLLPEEVLLVDDCSTDNTPLLLEKLRNDYSTDISIKVLSTEINSGPGSARNLGWMNSNCDYIAFLDSDDVWHPKKISIQYNWMIRNPKAVLTGHPVVVLGKDEKLKEYMEQEINVSIVEKISTKKFLFSNTLQTPTVMLKRKLDIKFIEGKKYSEDYLLWCEILFKYNQSYRIKNASLSCLLKPVYGASGLSGNLWRLEKGELDTYRRLYDRRYIGIFSYMFFSLYSLLKHFRRVFLVSLRKRR